MLFIIFLVTRLTIILLLLYAVVIGLGMYKPQFFLIKPAEDSSRKLFLKLNIRLFTVFFLFLLIGFLIPQNLKIPVENATVSDYNQESYWFHPWGRKGRTHKGVDIFAKKGTNLYSATNGVVLYTGTIGLGGKVVLILGPKWRLHYYAHLDAISTERFAFVSSKSLIGKVGDTGNAKGKPPHLHYSIGTLIPYIWKVDRDVQGIYKMIFLNPIPYLNRAK